MQKKTTNQQLKNAIRPIVESILREESYSALIPLNDPVQIEATENTLKLIMGTCSSILSGIRRKDERTLNSTLVVQMNNIISDATSTRDGLKDYFSKLKK